MAELRMTDWDAVAAAVPEPTDADMSALRGSVLMRIVRGPPGRRVPDMYRVRRALWAAVLEILAGEEPVLVYGPHGKAKMVPRRIAEQLHAEHKLRIAKSVADAHEKLGVPSVGIEASEEDAAWGVVEVPPKHLGTWMNAGAEPLTAERIQEMADAIKDTPPPRLVTWTCDICSAVCDINACGLMLFGCGGMICFGCERKFPEHRERCAECRDYVPPPMDDFDLSDTTEG